MEEVKIGKYLHHKGKYYEVIGTAKHSETLEELVVYRALYGNFDLWVRPKAMFLEKIEKNGKMIPRFTLQSSSPAKISSKFRRVKKNLGGVKINQRIKMNEKELKDAIKELEEEMPRLTGRL